MKHGKVLIKFQRKAEGLTMNVIVIAAISLLVLVVLALIFTGRIGIFSKGVAECETQGGKCFFDACGTLETPAEDYSAYRPADNACNKGTTGAKPYCCIPIK